jgi:hypothetical protein
MNVKKVLAILVIVAAGGLASTVIAMGSLTDHQAFATKGRAASVISEQGATNQSPQGASNSGVMSNLCIENLIYRA